MSLYGHISLCDTPNLENIRQLDLLPIPQIRRMQRAGVAVDLGHFRELSSHLESKLVELKADVSSYIPAAALDQFVGESGDDLDLMNVDSTEQIAKLLFELLGVGRGKRLKTTKSGARISTGKKQLEALRRDHPVIPKILEYREYSKLKGTFVDSLPRKARLHPKGLCCPICGLDHLEQHWRIHGTIFSTNTVAGRLSMRRPNLQQIPSRTKMGREVRKGFVAGPGKRLIAVDFSQLHLRLVAHLANEPNMISVFQADGDIHVETARRAFGLGPDEKPDKLTQRDPTKMTNFFILNRGGAPGLLEILYMNFALADQPAPDWLTLEWCGRFIDTWFGLYPSISEWFDLQDYRARRHGIVWCMFGRVRRVPEVQSVHERIVAAGLRQAGNHPLIASEAGIYKIAQARVEDRFEILRDQGVGVEAVIPVHDELVIECDEDWAEEVCEMVGYEMSHALTDTLSGQELLRVPLKTEGRVTPAWQKE